MHDAKESDLVQGRLARLARWVAVYSALFCLVSWILNWLSYRVLKNRILNRQEWDLNICCGTTDGGGVNVDIVQHDRVPNLILIDDIFHLPFKDKEFRTVLCSHTMEHVQNPVAFHQELQRVGEEVTLVVPPLWDITAAFNPIDHRWLFLTLQKEHRELPKHVRMPFSSVVHRIFGQRIRA